MKNFTEYIEAGMPLQNDPEHIIGNPVFAIETNLISLRKRITSGRTEEALEIVDEIQVSIERIKSALTQLQK